MGEADNKCSVPFIRICDFMEKLSGIKGKRKTQALKEFFEHSKVTNFFPIVRLMIPNFDMERGQYGLKEVTLAKYYAELLSLPNREKEALIHFKDPKKQLPGCPAGGFVEVLEFIIRNRVGDSQNLTVEEINAYLDDLANALDKPAKKKILSELVRRMSAIEQKWLVKIILKDMKLGTHEKLLSSFHDKALEIYYNTNNLREVFTKLKDKNIELGVQLFTWGQPIRPMLAGRKPFQELKKLLINQEVYVETKFDGERIQCHYCSDGNIKFFSRNAVDYTMMYGRSLRELILENVHGVNACILDGELIVWDLGLDAPASFGQNKTVANENTPGKCLCYMVFDILYIETADGTKHDLMPKPLSDRKQILDKTLTDVPKRLEKVKFSQVKGSKMVFDQFNVAIERNEEGLIIKRVDSPYIPDDRSSLWLKMKSDYFDGLSDSLDFLIVGGYYGSGHRTGDGDEFDHITVFLLASPSKIDLKDPLKSKFVPITKVGTGYSIPELGELRRRLRDQWKPFRQSPPYWPKWVPGPGERPDYFINDPSKSVILEVKAAEIVPSEKFPSNNTLRFPKVARIRYDKNWDQATSMTEVQTIIDSFKRGITEPTARIDAVQIEDEPTRKRKREIKTIPKGQVMPQFMDTDTSEIIPTSAIFDGCEFFIVSCRGYDKSDLEIKIVENGGRKVQNYLPTVTHIIASDSSSMKVRNLIEKYGLDILSPDWLVDCVKYQEKMELRPKYVLHASDETRNYFEKEFTKYGDSLSIPYRSVDELLEIAKNFPERELNQVKKTIESNWWNRIPEEIKANVFRIPAYKFLSKVFFIYKSDLPDPLFNGRDLWVELYQLKIEAHGGEVRNGLTKDVTHILNLGQRIRFESKAEVVDAQWINQMIAH
ncbi:unnamed protein product [Blepharisma stoltei]|uniref:DNA ligase n=1 Tax=Blepharisma stoltei TaxID=1481888 RepID=A0AAU9IIG0_9CILI|nr:unnamed protein product [Blepharisma stoltei]